MPPHIVSSIFSTSHVITIIFLFFFRLIREMKKETQHYIRLQCMGRLRWPTCYSRREHLFQTQITKDSLPFNTQFFMAERYRPPYIPCPFARIRSTICFCDIFIFSIHRYIVSSLHFLIEDCKVLQSHVDTRVLLSSF